MCGCVFFNYLTVSTLVFDCGRKKEDHYCIQNGIDKHIIFMSIQENSWRSARSTKQMFLLTVMSVILVFLSQVRLAFEGALSAKSTVNSCAAHVYPSWFKTSRAFSVLWAASRNGTNVGRIG